MSRSTIEFNQKFDETWEEIVKNNQNNCIPTNELKNTLDLLGYQLPNHEVRVLINGLKNEGKLNESEGISKELLKEICENQWRNLYAQNFKAKKAVKEDADLVQVRGTQEGAYHGYSKEEQRSFSQWINTHMNDFPELKHTLPINEEGSDLYSKFKDGIILCKLVNMAVPDTIDDRAINVGKNLGIFKKHENLTLGIQSAKSIGIHTINMDAHTLSEGENKQHLVLGLIWQIIARYLFSSITIEQVPGLMALLGEGETIEDLLKMGPEQILLRWVNYQLEKAGCTERVKNFSEDIKDSKVYTNLLAQVAPKEAKVNKLALQESDLYKRAEKTLDEAEKIECREFVTPSDIVQGQKNLNLAFVANLFNKHPALEDVEVDEDAIKETREEKMFRNWMNSLGVDPYVQYLYSDLQDGLILFQLFEFIQPGIVNWKKVVRSFNKNPARRNMEILSNCNYAVELGRKLNFVLVGIQGDDLKTGNKTLTLGLVWQLMRAYTLSLLSRLSQNGTPIVESEIITWANQRLEDAGKECRVKHFQDQQNKTALPVIHLIDSMQSGVIDYKIVKSGSKLTKEECMNNAKYALSMARRIGAPVYALPEDLYEVKHKMIMTVYASLMLVDMS